MHSLSSLLLFPSLSKVTRLIVLINILPFISNHGRARYTIQVIPECGAFLGLSFRTSRAKRDLIFSLFGSWVILLIFILCCIFYVCFFGEFQDYLDVSVLNGFLDFSLCLSFLIFTLVFYPSFLFDVFLKSET